MPSTTDRAVNARLRALDRRLQDIYNAAYETAVKNQAKDIEKLASLDVAALRAQGLDDTAIRAKQLAFEQQVERSTKIVDNIAAEIARSGETAAKIIKGEQLNIYQSAYKGALYDIDEQLGFGVDWTVYDRNQLRVLLADEDVQPFTKIAYKNLGSDKVVARRLQNELTQAVLNGEGIPAITRRIRNVTGQSLSQARTVARTETLRTANQGRMLGYRQAAEEYGIPMQKQWIATLDSRTRDTHSHMHMELAELDEPFSNGLQHPGDPAGSAAEVVNCRCTVVSVLKGLKGSKAYQELNERIGKERIYEAREEAKTTRQEMKEDFSTLKGVTTSSGVTVSKPSAHFMEQAQSRGISPSGAKDALQNSLNVGKIRTDKETGKRSQTFVGRNGTVAINPDTGILITTYPTGSDRLKKYGGDKK